MRAAMRKREAIQPRKIGKVEADVFLYTAGRNGHSRARECVGSTGVNRAWRAYEVMRAYPGDLAGSAGEKER